jgi:hypothetical protein
MKTREEEKRQEWLWTIIGSIVIVASAAGLACALLFLR